MHNVLKPILFCLLTVQLLFGAKTIPDIEPIDDYFGPQNGWTREELNIFDADFNGLLRLLCTRSTKNYPTIGKVLSGVTIHGKYHTIKGINDTVIHLSGNNYPLSSPYVTKPKPFRHMKNIDFQDEKGFSAILNLTQQGKLKYFCLYGVSDTENVQKYEMRITYVGEQPSEVYEDGVLVDSAVYDANGVLQKVGDRTFQYTNEGRLHIEEDSTMQFVYEWTEKDKGYLSKKRSDIDKSEGTITSIYDVSYNSTNLVSSWVYEDYRNKFFIRGDHEYSLNGMAKSVSFERKDSLEGEWEWYWSEMHSYNDQSHLYRYTVIDDLNKKMEKTTTKYEYNEHQWPVLIITEYQEGATKTVDTVTISYEGLAIIPHKTVKTSQNLSACIQHGALHFSKELPDNAYLSLCNVKGQEVFAQRLRTNARVFLPPSIAKGLYFWNLSIENKKHTGRVIVH